MFNKTKTVKVADMKQILVDEIKKGNKNYKKIKSLEKEIKKKSNVEKEYELALITIDALNERINERDITSNQLKKEISNLTESLNKEKERCNDKEIKINILQDKINQLNSNIEAEVNDRVKHSNLAEINVLIKEKIELKKVLNNKDKIHQDTINNLLKNIITNIQSTKGNISKDCVIKIIEKEFRNNEKEKIQIL